MFGIEEFFEKEKDDATQKGKIKKGDLGKHTPGDQIGEAPEAGSRHSAEICRGTEEKEMSLFERLLIYEAVGEDKYRDLL